MSLKKFYSYQKSDAHSKPGSQRKDGMRVVYLFLIIVLLAISSFIYNKVESNNFEKSKAITNGVIIDVFHDVYDAEYMSYNRYIIGYTFSIDDQQWKKNVDIRNDKLHHYFKSIPQIGDTIRIEYLPGNPSTSKIVKIQK